MVSAIMPWYEPSQLCEGTWLTNPWVEEDFPAFYWRSLRNPLTPELMARFLSENVSAVDFSYAKDSDPITPQGTCKPGKFPTWQISIYCSDPRTVASEITLVHEIMHGFYRAKGQAFTGYGSRLILDQRNTPGWVKGPDDYERLRNLNDTDHRIEEMAQQFFVRNIEYVIATLDALKGR